MPVTRAFFLGAGASRADGFPLTKHIICGAIKEALADDDKYERPLTFLRVVFGLSSDELHDAARLWTEFVDSPDMAGDPGILRVPDIVELLSLLDVLISEEATVAGKRKSNGHVEAFGARELSRVREHTSRAVAASIAALARRRKTSGTTHTTDFVDLLRPDDVVITTNWDLLLDRALHFRFGTDSDSLGSDVIVTNEDGDPSAPLPATISRPPLFKLHGSLNWLTCLRCTRLYVNPTYHTADLGFLRTARGGPNTCHCGMPLRAVLITPTYFKQYRSRHLANIWANAQQRLAQCTHWYFIGYSLPADDVHIRAFLLRALHMCAEGTPPPKVTIVRDDDDTPTKVRYQRLFRAVDVFGNGFGAFPDHLRLST